MYCKEAVNEFYFNYGIFVFNSLLTYLRHKIVKPYLISVLTILYLSIKGKKISFLEGLSSVNNIVKV